jgi:hypothetical protein
MKVLRYPEAGWLHGKRKRAKKQPIRIKKEPAMKRIDSKVSTAG